MECGPLYLKMKMSFGLDGAAILSHMDSQLSVATNVENPLYRCHILLRLIFINYKKEGSKQLIWNREWVKNNALTPNLHGSVHKTILHDFLKIWICLNVIVNAIGDINKYLYCWKYMLKWLKRVLFRPNFGHF